MFTTFIIAGLAFAMGALCAVLFFGGMFVIRNGITPYQFISSVYRTWHKAIRFDEGLQRRNVELNRKVREQAELIDGLTSAKA